MKGISLLFKHLCIALILVVAVVVLDMTIRMEWPRGVDSFFLAIAFYLLFYFVPLVFLTILLDVLVIQKTPNGVIRYFFGLVLGVFLIAYHFLFILNGKVITEKHHFIIYEAFFMGIASVFLTERLFKSKVREPAQNANS